MMSQLWTYPADGAVIGPDSMPGLLGTSERLFLSLEMPA